MSRPRCPDPLLSEAFGGGRCQFFVTPERHFVELAEMPAETFSEFFETSLAGA